MTASQLEFASVVDTLVHNVRDLLRSDDARSRVRAIHHLALGIEALERQVLLDAQASGLSWAQIGEVYGVSRQAAHRRFADETVVPGDFFDQLVAELAQDHEVVSSLARAAQRVRHVTAT